MNAIERLIAAVSPAAALRRARALAALDHISALKKRSYEGAKRGRRTEGWTTRPTSANAEIGPALTLLRDRNRDLVRNNPYAYRAGSVWTSNVIGSGIVPRAADAHIELFRRWSDVCDADDRDDFFGLQALIADTEWEGGEALVRFRPRRLDDGLPVPLQLQVLEPDHLDTGRNAEVKGGGVIIQGVEFNAIGERVAYWLFPTHPGDVMPFSRRANASQRVPADGVLHVFRRRRAGQVRGVPELASVMLRLRDLDDYEDAELLRKKIEACFVAFVTNVEGEPPSDPAIAASNGQLVEMLEPGTTKYLKEGQDVTFGAPAGVGGYGEYMRVQLHAVAAGAGVTYQQLTGDMSQANYSSMRGGLLEFRRMMRQFQHRVVVHQFCRPVWRRFNDAGVLSGALTKVEPARWQTPKFDAVDPLKDAMADLVLTRSGFKTLFDAIAEYGGDPKTAVQEMKAIADALDKAGLVLDTDPRKTSKSGVFQDAMSLESADQAKGGN